MRPVGLVFAALVTTFAASAAADDPAWEEERASARSDVEGSLGTMQRTAQEVREMLRETRRRGSKREVVCLDGALSRVDVALRRARENGARSLAAYARGDVEEARTGRQRVAEWREAQRLAARDANVCVPRPVGVPTLTKSRTSTKVTLEVDPRVARAE